MSWLQSYLHYDVSVIPFVFVSLVIAFTVHEFAHAYSAYKFGDPTPKAQGRVTLDPRKHLDILGTVLIFVAGFGWAKPVQVNRSFFRRPRLMGIVVSALGPVSNLLIAFVGVAITGVLYKLGYRPEADGTHLAVHTFLYYLVQLNIILFIFNLIPLPPLDGYRIVEDLVTDRFRAKLTQVQHWGIFIFLLLVFIPPLYNATVGPLFSLWQPIRSGMVAIVNAVLG